MMELYESRHIFKMWPDSTNKQTRHIVTCLYIQQPPQFADQMAAGVEECSLCPALSLSTT